MNTKLYLWSLRTRLLSAGVAVSVVTVVAVFAVSQVVSAVTFSRLDSELRSVALAVEHPAGSQPTSPAATRQLGPPPSSTLVPPAEATGRQSPLPSAPARTSPVGPTGPPGSSSQPSSSFPPTSPSAPPPDTAPPGSQPPGNGNGRGQNSNPRSPRASSGATQSVPMALLLPPREQTPSSTTFPPDTSAGPTDSSPEPSSSLPAARKATGDIALTITDPQGNIVELSGAADAPGPYQMPADAVVASVAGWRVVKVDREAGGVITAALPLGPTESALRAANIGLASAAGLVLAALWLSLWWLLRFGVSPLRTVTAAAARIARGEPNVRVPTGSGPSELGALADAFNHMVAVQEESLVFEQDTARMMREFAADASHELRTPLTALRGWIELLEADKLSPDLRKEALSHLDRESARMVRLVESLLELTRAQRPVQTGVPQACDVSAALAGACADHRVVDPSRPVRFECQPGLFLAVAPDALVQVAQNLLANLRTHTPEGTQALLRARSVSSTMGVLEYQDDGPGAGANPERALERFWQADKSRTTSGFGIGLAVVVAVAKSAGGSTEAFRSERGGFGVKLMLPLAASQIP